MVLEIFCTGSQLACCFVTLDLPKDGIFTFLNWTVSMLKTRVGIFDQFAKFPVILLRSSSIANFCMEIVPILQQQPLETHEVWPALFQVCWFLSFWYFQLKMWVFPEGTRKNTGELHSFKKGAFHVAVAAQVPIQPVVFSPFYFLDNKERTFNQGKRGNISGKLKLLVFDLIFCIARSFESSD